MDQGFKFNYDLSRWLPCGKIVLEMGGGHLMSQDLETKETKDLGIIGYMYNFVDAYIESLILLDKAANAVVTY